MIHFKELYIEGFGSFVNPFEFNFGSQGLTLIKGENGAGKTTLFSALSWIIYDRPLKEHSTILTWEHIRPTHYKGAKGWVIITRGSKTYKIIRCKEYSGEITTKVKGDNRLVITDVEGNDLFSQKKKQEVQAEIVKIMGMSYEVFKVCLVFGQKMKRLIEEDGPTKKKVFEEAFDAAFISKAKDIAQKRYNDLQKEYIPLDKKFFGITERIDSKKEAITNIQNKMATFETEKKARVENLIKLREKLIKEWDEMGKAQLGYDELVSRLKELKDKKADREKAFDQEAYYKVVGQLARQTTSLTSYENSLDKEEIKLAKAKKSAKCPLCGGPLKDDKKQEYLEEITSTINQLTNAIADTKRSIQGHKIELASLTKKKIALESNVKKIKELETQIANNDFDPSFYKTMGSDIVSLAAQILRVKDEQINFGEEAALLELEVLKKEAKVIYKDLRKVKIRYETQGWLYSDALSNSGLKAFIFNKMLHKLNIILEQYSKTLGIRPYFEIDMAGARKDIKAFVQKDGHVVPFEDLSGGQAQIANVIIAFGTHDLIAKGKFNILILDEVFESLTSSSIEVVTDLILAKTLKQHVYLITHIKDFNPTGANTLEFKLQDGATRPLL